MTFNATVVLKGQKDGRNGLMPETVVFSESKKDPKVFYRKLLFTGFFIAAIIGSLLLDLSFPAPGLIPGG